MRDKARKERGWLFFAIVLTILLYGVWIGGEILYFNWALAKYDWAQHDGGFTSQLKLRIICHKIISHWTGNHHDAFITLDNVGNSDSIPYLINALKWHEPADGIDVAACTTDHCVDCLKKLTGLDFGYSHKDWLEWWQNQGVKMSREELDALAVQPEKKE